MAAPRRSKNATDTDRPQVYRFFASASECAGYLDGSWQGTAMQGIADWSPADRMQLRLDCVRKGDAAQLNLRLTAVRASRRWWQRLRIPFRGGNAGSQAHELFAATTSLDRKQSIAFVLKDPAVDAPDSAKQHEFASDYAQLLSTANGEWELSVQVLEAVRAHCQLSRRDAERGPVIYFSGVVTKTR